METRRLVFIGVGGQGNLLATRLLGEAALSLGIPAVVSEIHGMAQRGGIVESAVLMGEVTSPIVSPSEADVLVGFEPMETLRAMNKCNPDSVVIANTRPLPPFTVSVGQGVYPPVEKILDLIGRKVRRLIAFDATARAEEAGNRLTLNMVMLGALIAAQAVPVDADTMKRVLSTSTRKSFLESNLKAFELGLASVN